MPTLLKIDGLRVVIYPNDHRPAHVHVMGNGGEAVFHLQCPEGPPLLRESHGFKQRELARTALRLARELQPLCRAWREIHGHYH